MKLPAYPRYKPSGVEWLGDVPEHWDVKRLKTSARCWVSNVDKVPAEDELPVRLCNYTDVYYHEEITADLELMATTATAEEIDHFGLREGDVVITKDSEDWRDIAVPALVRNSAPDLVCGYHLGIIRSRPEVLVGDYLLRVFQSRAINQQFQVAASGVTRYGLPKASIGDARIPIPAPNEQHAISTFLDRETGRVSRLVAKKRDLIERLKEKRIALISRVVTRGLPPAECLRGNPPLRPSGIEWLGDIPRHWNVDRLRRQCVRITDGAHISPDLTSADYPFVSTVDLSNGTIDLMGCLRTSQECYDYLVRTGCRPFDGDVLFSKDGTVGRTAVVGNTDDFVVASSLVIVSPKRSKLNSRFLNYWLNNDLLQQDILLQLSGAALKRISVEKVSRLPVILPPVSEQCAIVAYLDAATTKLEVLVQKVEEAIERLDEYRTALVTAAVTGKIDVRKEFYGK